MTCQAALTSAGCCALTCCLLLQLWLGSRTTPRAALAPSASEGHLDSTGWKTMLQAAGYDAEVLPILVGTTRCVYRSTEANLKRLGVSHEAVQRLLRKLAVEAARPAHAIICTRRQLDSQSQVQRRDPP